MWVSYLDSEKNDCRLRKHCRKGDLACGAVLAMYDYFSLVVIITLSLMLSEI